MTSYYKTVLMTHVNIGCNNLVGLALVINNYLSADNLGCMSYA